MRKEIALIGIEKMLYKFQAFSRSGKKLATVYAVDYSKLGALLSCEPYFPKGYKTYQYDHVRPAKDSEAVGVIMNKNNKKRK